MAILNTTTLFVAWRLTTASGMAISAKEHGRPDTPSYPGSRGASRPQSCCLSLASFVEAMFGLAYEYISQL